MVALKIMKNPGGMDNSMMDLVMNEIEIMKDLDHPNIVKLLDYSEEAEYKRPNGTKVKVFYLALELVSGGELFDFIAETGRFTEEVARYFFHQMIAGLEYLHTQGISHRDIKPENMMLDADYNLKIADFGFSSSQALNETKRGTDGYMAPEIYKGIEYSGQCVDLFATGIILFIMVSQHPPFNAASAKDPHYKLLSTNRHDVFWKIHTKRKPGGIDFFSESFRDLVSAMLSYNPHERPSLAEIKSHEWYNGPIPTYEEI
jgi:serine/threonine protein kinase